MTKYLFVFFFLINQQLHAQALIDVEQLLVEIEESLYQDFFENQKKCADDYSKRYEELFSIKKDNLLLSNLSISILEEIIRKSFYIRSEIKKIADKRKFLSPYHCLNALKNITRALRYVEDYSIEYLASLQNETPEYETLTGEFPYFQVSDEFKSSFLNYNDLQSGDVILSRGNAYSSAAIARIGENDTHFSHLSIVYKDEITGELYTVEAHIEIGNVVAPFQKHLEEKNARSVVYRFVNPEIAAKAAKIMFEKVKNHSEKYGQNIPYDFAMDYRDISEIFCSEVIYHGYRIASSGEIDLPEYKTRFNKNLVPFLKNLGLKITDKNYKTFVTFSPADIHFDSRFKMVAEWRNPQKIQDTRFKDMILTKIFHWMEKRNYELKPTLTIQSKALALVMARRSIIGSRLLKGKFPRNMKKEQLEVFMMLDIVGETFYNHLIEVQKRRTLPLSPFEIQSSLESFLRKDAKHWIKDETSKLKVHQFFHPRK